MEENQLFVQNALEVGRNLITTTHTLAETTTSYLYLLIIFFSTALIIGIIIVFFTKQKNVKEYLLNDADTPFVAIHIPIKNDIVGINCAKKCLAFNYPKQKYKILIGDDSTDPEISKQLHAFARKHKNITIYKRDSNKGYKAGNLNNLLKHTNQEFIVTFDSDFLPEPDFLRRIIATHDVR